MKRFLPVGLQLFWLLCGWAGGELAAHPINFMVGDYVFPRPAPWRWVQLDEKAKIAAKLLVKGDDGAGEADIVFVESKTGGGWASAEQTLERWGKNFEEPIQQQHWQREERIFGQRTATFLWQEGTYKTVLAGGIRLETDFAQYGVVIADGKNNILARILGRKTVVEKAKADFKNMIEAPLRENE